MKLAATALPGVWLVEFERLSDERGWFARLYDADFFAAHGLCVEYPQQSEAANTRRGTIRGLHYQAAPHAETKLVRCVRGAVYDVVVDVRRESPSYGRWASFELGEDDSRALYIPDGFAHGYQTLRDRTDLHYLISVPYAPDAARGIAYDSPALAIPWPLPVTTISARDRALPAF
jgi:dTDP-4-dehydrorhamnose 3,5-epimerase